MNDDGGDDDDVYN